MSIRRDSSGDTPLDVGSILGDTPYTITYWMKRVGFGDGWDVPVSIDDDSTNAFTYVSRNDTNNDWRLYGEGGSDGAILDAPPTADAWYFVAYHADNSSPTESVEGYWKEDGDAGLTVGPSVTAANKTYDHLMIFESPWSGPEWFNGSIVAVKLWDVELTQTEIETEMDEQAAQKTSDLVGEYWLNDTATMTTDSSAAGNDLTGGTGLATDSDVPDDLNLVAGDVTVTPAVINTSAALPTPTILAASTVTPAVVDTAATLPTPTILAASLVAPAVVDTAATIPTPTILAASTVTPAVIDTAATLPTPVIVIDGPLLLHFAQMIGA